MSFSRKCAWCGKWIGALAGAYCSAGCAEGDRAWLFNRDKHPREKWVRFAAEVPPELAEMLDEAQQRAMGINRPSATRAGLVRDALRMYLDAMAPLPEPAVDASADEYVGEVPAAPDEEGTW